MAAHRKAFRLQLPRARKRAAELHLAAAEEAAEHAAGALREQQIKLEREEPLRRSFESLENENHLSALIMHIVGG